VFDWRLAEGVVDPARLIVSGGLRPENVGDAVAHLRPFGVDVDSGVESAPGRKDPVKLRAFVAAARAAAGEEMAAEEVEGDDEGDEGPGGIDRPFDWREEEG
jgi:phosphoribosylanthranilate isomerase